MEPGLFAAFVSGVKVAILPYTIAFIIEMMLNIFGAKMQYNMQFHIFGLIFCIACMIFIKSYDPFYYHKIFYGVFFITEIMTMIF